MTSTASPARTQRRGTETKRRLIEATKGLLAEYDYQTITLDRIASEVGVAKSSILWHFGSKESLLTDAVFHLFEEVDQKITLEKTNLDTLAERIDYLLKSVAEYFAANPKAKGITITLVFNSQVPKAIHARIRKQWQQHNLEIRNFLSSEDIQVSEEAAAAILALMHGSYLQWYLCGQKSDIRKLLPGAFMALRHEIGRMLAEEQIREGIRES